ncbi:MAG TPA: hypothetical protein PLG56_00180 [Lacunisphaera sp.]|nr:hypothetical protein [Lacunisphaera sp.]
MDNAKQRKRAPRPGEGRPTTYRREYVRQAEVLANLGATDADLATAFGVSIMTIRRWQSSHEEFCCALKVQKGNADDRVERSLYQRAVGYSHDAQKIVVDPKTGRTTTVEYVEHYPPDTTAAIFWLKNRRREQWRDKQEVEHSGGLEIKDAAADEAKRKLAALIAGGAGRDVAGKPDA